jgi:translation initiation factor IF-1
MIKEGMANKDIQELEGEVIEALPNTMFRVTIDETQSEDFAGRTLLCTLSGKMRMYRIRVMPGDKVKIEVTPYDQDRGRITFRVK